MTPEQIKAWLQGRVDKFNGMAAECDSYGGHDDADTFLIQAERYGQALQRIERLEDEVRMLEEEA
ncbi:MAG: hypothetical protein DHS20C21_03080 [Gemmatimonadota bacterium]|nr:MAG: hypothetical protein DHS20C21_03080 [Gemmatimonadota bacterium]